ncbi:MAG: sodium:calcium antiporter [Candidatus Dormibacteraeota bacterium]|uniref:Sodium:calcium antiporter n=2 Tax=Candidatus Aeolococcus gillhamiae TaxID=3127015 RepID=A0A934JTA8_9BACT|nr:sodium:calcium antiporter [Candidatus Dormibacteraeota bacterium]
MSEALLFGGGLILIVAASELFTNAVEWAGFRMKLASGATGSLLAALGTSLPETVVPVIALIGGQASAASVATGAVLGSAFLLLGVGTALTGVAVVMRSRRRRLELDTGQVRRDLGLFIGAFSVVLIAIVLPRPVRIPVGACLLLAYALYVRATLRGSAPAHAAPEPLHIVRWHNRDPASLLIALQLAGAVAMLIVGSDLFVSALNQVAQSLHTNPLTLALIVVPVATELPETINSVLWIRSGDDNLAFGNVAGSSAFQACVLGFIGLSFTPWSPDFNGVLSGLLTLGTAVYLFALLRSGSAHGRWLLLAGLPWVGYVVAELLAGGRLGG